MSNELQSLCWTFFLSILAVIILYVSPPRSKLYNTLVWCRGCICSAWFGFSTHYCITPRFMAPSHCRKQKMKADWRGEQIASKTYQGSRDGVQVGGGGVKLENTKQKKAQNQRGGGNYYFWKQLRSKPPKRLDLVLKRRLAWALFACMFPTELIPSFFFS